MDVTYFRQRKPGPEVMIEDAVVNQIPTLFPRGSYPIWTAGSIPIGAGRPDLVIVLSKPQVFALAKVEMPIAGILAYLRVTDQAHLEVIINHMNEPREKIVRSLTSLLEIKAVINGSETYSLSPIWREILPEIITIEIKVSDWRRGICQATRNSIFAHRSFIALPERVAQRIKSKPILHQNGIGLLSVKDSREVAIVGQGRRHKPRVWTYYYELASLVAIRSQEC